MSAVVIAFHHFSDLFQQAEIIKGQPAGGKHLVGRFIGIQQVIISGPPLHRRSFQHLEKAGLQLLGTKAEDIVKRRLKCRQIFEGKTGDQIQMDMDIVPGTDTPDGGSSRTHFFQHFKIVFVQQIRRNFEVKIRNSVIMF